MDAIEETPEIIKNIYEAQLLSAFEKGDSDMFFALWDDHIRPKLAVPNPLELLSSVYFAIFPIRNNDESQTEISMNKFKVFLQTRGGDWAGQPDYLQYYALPYLPDPTSHPSFKDLFVPEWKSILLSNLTEFINGLLPTTTPALVTLIRNKDLKETPQTKIIVDHQKEEMLEGKLQDLRTDYQQLISVASELVSMLTAAINKETIAPAYLGDIVRRLGGLKKNGQSQHTKQKSGVHTRKVSVKDSKSQNATNEKTNLPQKPVIPPVKENKKKKLAIENINYRKLREEIILASDDERRETETCKLISAQRSVLLNAINAEQRRNILDSMITQDFLGLIDQNQLLYNLLNHNSALIREEIAKLLNTLATDCAGREYLLVNEGTMVYSIIESLKEEKFDNIFRQNLLGTLQKLSLRRLAQSKMNHAGMISYLINMLNNLTSLSEYSIEYGTALFMNLCLRSQGKREACTSPELTLKILNELIDHDNIQVKTYVNGCLYSLFADSKMREYGQSIDMESQLKCLKQTADESLAKQIDFVIEKLLDEEVEDDYEDSEDGEEEDGFEDDEELIDEDSKEDASTLQTILIPFCNSKPTSPVPKIQISPKKRIAGIARAAEVRAQPQEELSPKHLLSMQIQLPLLETTKKGKMNLPISNEE
ncbi:LisH domain-containing protein armc9 [Boothiomyces sp. JEL0838]|nr:LisH domain-containing protein armc9 [Boothiomyces sp. JEL0838]